VALLDARRHLHRGDRAALAHDGGQFRAGPPSPGRIGLRDQSGGSIIPVGVLSIIGWFWFKADTFAAAWNPNGLTLSQGMGSSIRLTLWAFLGMESAAQTRMRWENPKRDVPLPACSAPSAPPLSTSVHDGIQGHRSERRPVNSTGRSPTAYAHMFTRPSAPSSWRWPVLACLGSLLGWQFTIAQTGKSAGGRPYVPPFFSKVNRLGAPVHRHARPGGRSTVMGGCLSISPRLSEQFQRPGEPRRRHQRRALHHRPVALIMMMKTHRSPRRLIVLNVWCADRDGLQHLPPSILRKDAVLGGACW